MKAMLIRSAFAAVIAASVFGLVTIGRSPSQGQRLARSVVRVLNFEGTGGGTGWVTRSASGRRVIVTNDHVCEVAKDGMVRIQDDSGTSSIKEVLTTSFDHDLCLIEGIEAPALTVAKTGPNRFDDLTVVGHPLLGPLTMSKGQFTGISILPIGGFVEEGQECPHGTETVQSLFGTVCIHLMELGTTTAQIYPGNSGSPVINTDGEVIGVMNSGDGMMFHGNLVTLNYLRDILNTK
jgi:S1-C subfamily serine protease